ncbi:Geraniol 8-hydroxylase [Linum perenne]
MKNHYEKVLNLFGRIIDERLKKRKSEKYVSNNDVLDTLLDITEGNGEVSMDLNLIKYLFLDVFVAGTDTSSATLEWAMAELLRNPNTFAKARDELDQIIGKGNDLQESDITQLPYLQAILKETFRFELIPFGGGRRICPGLPLAMRMLHVMLGSLIHWFDWKLHDGVDPKKLDMEEKIGATLQKAKPLIVIPRPR